VSTVASIAARCRYGRHGVREQPAEPLVLVRQQPLARPRVAGRLLGHERMHPLGRARGGRGHGVVLLSMNASVSAIA
jgi:hypothetical protein